MDRQTNLVNYPRRNPEELTVGLPIIVITNPRTGEDVFSSYHTTDLDKKRAKRNAAKLLVKIL